MPGSWMSMRMRSGCSALASASPFSASVALSTLCPTDSSRNVDSVMLAGLSSTTNTFAMSDGHLTTRHCSTDLDGEMASVEVPLLHDRRHIAIQLVAVLGGDLFGRDHQDWYARRLGIIMKRRHHVEAVHFGHHQIEHDQIGYLPSRNFYPVATAIRAQDLARQAIDVELDQGHFARIVVDHKNAQLPARLQRNQVEIGQRIVQFLPRERLLHHRRSAEREPLVPIGYDRDYHDRSVFERRYALEASKQFPTVHLRQHDVQRYQ